MALTEYICCNCHYNFRSSRRPDEMRGTVCICGGMTFQVVREPKTPKTPKISYSYKDPQQARPKRRSAYEGLTPAKDLREAYFASWDKQESGDSHEPQWPYIVQLVSAALGLTFCILHSFLAMLFIFLSWGIMVRMFIVHPPRGD